MTHYSLNSDNFLEKIGYIKKDEQHWLLLDIYNIKNFDKIVTELLKYNKLLIHLQLGSLHSENFSKYIFILGYKLDLKNNISPNIRFDYSLREPTISYIVYAEDFFKKKRLFIRLFFIMYKSYILKKFFIYKILRNIIKY
jgi:hypothetical protein